MTCADCSGTRAVLDAFGLPVRLRRWGHLGGVDDTPVRADTARPRANPQVAWSSSRKGRPS